MAWSVAVLAACTASSDGPFGGSEAGRSQDGGSPDAGEMRGGTSGAVGPSDGLAVRLQVDEPALCGGRCTRLTAQVSGARAEVHHAWSAGLPDTAGPHEVCPTETTTYSVQVLDGPTGLELLGRREASATATVQVAATCEASPGDDAGVLEAPDQPACRVSIESAVDFAVAHADGIARSDAAGNLYVLGSFRGRVTAAPGQHVDAGDLLSEGRVLLLKYDARCQFEWLRPLGPANNRARYGALDVDRSGSAVVTYDVQTEPDVPRVGVLARYATNGDLLWQRDGGQLSAHTDNDGIAIADDGRIAVQGYAECDALGTDEPGTGVCVSVRSAQGDVLFAHSLLTAKDGSLAFDSKGNVYVSGVAYPQPVQAHGHPATELVDCASGQQTCLYVVSFDVDGGYRWGGNWVMPADANVLDYRQGFVREGPVGEINAAIASRPVGEVPVLQVLRLDGDGQELSFRRTRLAPEGGAYHFTGAPGGQLYSALEGHSVDGSPTTTSRFGSVDRDGHYSAGLERVNAAHMYSTDLQPTPSGQLVYSYGHRTGDEVRDVAWLYVERL